MSSYGTAYGAGVLDYLREGQYTQAARAAVYSYVPTAVGASSLMDTRAWDTRRLVRTRGDLLALARWAFADVARRYPAHSATYSNFARGASAMFPSSLTLPQMLAKLRDAVAPSPSTRAVVVSKAAEYYRGVEQGQQVPQVPSSRGISLPVFPVAPVSEVPVVAEVVPFYRKTWFAPVAAVAAVGVVAAVIASRGR